MVCLFWGFFAFDFMQDVSKSGHKCSFFFKVPAFVMKGYFSQAVLVYIISIKQNTMWHLVLHLPHIVVSTQLGHFH